MSRMRSGSLLASMLVLILALDLGTKALAVEQLTLGRPLVLIEGMLRLTLVHNTGTAFGLFPGQRLAFVAFSCVAIMALAVLYRRLHRPSAVQVMSIALLLGGAIGNLHDRLRFGAVIDFLEIGVRHHYWPVFNVADAAISIGVLLLALGMLRGERRHLSPS
jgi:signal peptidase II